ADVTIEPIRVGVVTPCGGPPRTGLTKRGGAISLQPFRLGVSFRQNCLVRGWRHEALSLGALTSSWEHVLDRKSVPMPQDRGDVLIGALILWKQVGNLFLHARRGAAYKSQAALHRRTVIVWVRVLRKQ